MADQVIWEKLSVHHPDEHTDYIVHRGADLPDWVERYDREVLRSIGAVRFHEDAEPAPLQDVRPEDAPPTEPAVPEQPAKNASKADWVDYAVTQGVTRAEAERATKDELVALYGGE